MAPQSQTAANPNQEKIGFTNAPGLKMASFVVKTTRKESTSKIVTELKIKIRKVCLLVSFNQVGLEITRKCKDFRTYGEAEAQRQSAAYTQFECA